jgi:D-beta-D-heptose 7-phosphate kinase/D-beta-D-heptose 1-phosphate adenosyltransferase
MNRILLIGDDVLDEFNFCKIKRKNPENPNAPLLSVIKTETKLGGAENVFTNLVSLGLLVRKIPTQYINNLSVKTRYFVEDQLIFRSDKDKILKTLTYNVDLINFDAYDYLILSDYAKGAIQNPQHIIKFAKQKNPNIKIFVDPKKNFSEFKGSYCLKCNVEEFEKYWDKFTDDNMQKLATKNHHELVIVTLGANGVRYCYDGKISSFRGIDVTVKDVTGAGDCFLAALIRNHIMGYAIERCIASANRAAAKSVTQIGTYNLKPEDCDQVIVFTNGCFDLLHEGHLHLLKEAEKLGDRLVIAINSDSSVKRLKGDLRPINNEATRIADLWNSGYSNVVIFEEDTPINILDSVRPDFVVKGGDYKEDEVISGGAHVKIVPLLGDYSTTKIVEENYGNY